MFDPTHTHKQSLFRVHSDSKTSNTQCTMPTMHHNAQTTCGVRTPLFLRSNWRQWLNLHDWDTGICKCKWQGGILQLLQYYILPFFIVFHKSEVVKSVSSSTCCKHVSNSTMLRWFNSFKVNTFYKRVLHGQKNIPYHMKECRLMIEVHKQGLLWLYLKHVCSRLCIEPEHIN